MKGLTYSKRFVELQAKDRDRYYYGVDDIFRLENANQETKAQDLAQSLNDLGRNQPDVVEDILLEAPLLAITLLDGLIWRSHKTQDLWFEWSDMISEYFR